MFSINFFPFSSFCVIPIPYITQSKFVGEYIIWEMSSQSF